MVGGATAFAVPPAACTISCRHGGYNAYQWWVNRKRAEGVIMKRDMDLVRKILLALEENEDDFETGWQPEIDDHSFEEICYHLEIMKEAGLLEADIEREIGSPLPIIYLRRLTWEGHEFLDSAREESLWNRAKQKTVEATGGLSLHMLKGVLLKLGEQALE